jgi:N-methylhydantoinase A/oxoprolinase/acetone carboxylase beta subunit
VCDDKARWRIGIDVGGTNTDAVVVDEDDRLVVSTKTPTTVDLTSGIRAALNDILSRIHRPSGDITAVVLGTTQATNALVERKSLDLVGVVRIGSPVSDAAPPLAAWPGDLRQATVGGFTTVAGGHLIDGHRIAPLDCEALKRFFEKHAGSVDAVALSGVFSPIYPDDELAAADIARDVMGDTVRISLGHTIGQLGLLERENATVLNAALGRVGHGIVDGLRHAMWDHGLTLAPYIAQNDGTIMDVGTAMQLPILTIGSGPANSLRGAALLSGVDDAIVADVGGTTTDLGVLTEGFGRESSKGSVIGGVHTNFPMPDVISLPFGGGTVIRGDRVGPDSVGHLLHKRAISFGGDTATMTDAAVSCDRLTLPDKKRPSASPEFLRALDAFDEAVADAVAALTVHRRRLPVIAVGGGNALIPEQLPGVGDVLRVEHADVANAVGAASAMVGAAVEAVAPVSRRTAALEEAKDRAVAKAVAAGADPRATHPVTVTETSLGYTNEPTVRLKVKAAGPIANGRGRKHPRRTTNGTDE